MLPLYQEAQSFKANAADGHRGLWWARFFDKFPADFGKPEDGAKGQFIQAISKDRCGDGDTLTRSAARNKALVEKLSGEVRCFQTQGRFATGMGNDHPTENGFTWHHTLGAPYLPASSVKGLVRGWLEWQWGQDALKKKGGDGAKRRQLRQWFGSEHKDPREQSDDHQAGWFIFFDALPTDAVMLAADVMTPHYDKWYELGGGDPLAANTVPADWHNPVPVIFLTVKKATFQFGVAIREGLSDADRVTARADLSKVMDVLKDALEWAGAGAKTAVGYGRMGPEKGSALAQQTTTGDWQECTAKFNAGKQLLTVIVDGKAIECGQDGSKRYLSNCPEANKTRWKKEKPVKAKVKVSTLGNMKLVTELDWIDPSQ